MTYSSVWLDSFPFLTWRITQSCSSFRPSVLQCVAVCCSVLQCDVVWCSVLQFDAACCSVMQWVAVGCSGLQWFAVCCSVLQCAAVCCSVLQCVAVCCSVLQCVEVSCSVLKCDAVCCSVLQCVAVWHMNQQCHCLHVVLCKMRAVWRRYTECLKLQVSFRKRNTNHKVFWQKMTYEDQTSHASFNENSIHMRIWSIWHDMSDRRERESMCDMTHSYLWHDWFICHDCIRCWRSVALRVYLRDATRALRNISSIAHP